VTRLREEAHTVVVTREELMEALARVGSEAAQSARSALVEGADFDTHASAGQLPARYYWRIWATRERIFRKREQPSEYLAWITDALPELERAGEEPLQLWTVRRRDGRCFFLYMSAGADRCVACL
jgi:hypothetical protein